jgi:hypothetical protein
MSNTDVHGFHQLAMMATAAPATSTTSAARQAHIAQNANHRLKLEACRLTV